MRETKFKQTEIGMIPCDWEVKKLGDLGEPCMCKRILKQQTSSVGDIPFYKIGTFGGEPDAYISRSVFEEFKAKYNYPKKGTLLLSAAGTIGRVVVFDGKDSYFQDSNIVWIDNDEKIVLNDFLYYCYSQMKWTTENGGTVSRLYNENLKSASFAAPKSIEEQKRIAQALSDVDAVISTTEKLIAKKKALKQGAMQQLLTGKVRLGKFGAKSQNNFKMTELGPIPQDWEVKNILEILIQSKDGLKIGPFGSQLKKEYLLSQGDYKVFGQENIYTGNFDYCYRFLTKHHFKNLQSCELKEGDFVISTMGTIGKCDVVPSNAGIGIMDSHLVRLRLSKNVDKKYFKYYFQSSFIQNQIKSLSVGGIMDGLSTSIIKKLNVVLLPKEEQTAIATVLSDMDTEIATLETKLAKYRHLKTGMMQQLLTGKVRLV